MAKKSSTHMLEVAPPPLEGLLDIDGVARLLGVGPDMILKLRKEDGLPYIVFGPKCVRYDPRDVNVWLAEYKAERRAS